MNNPKQNKPCERCKGKEIILGRTLQQGGGYPCPICSKSKIGTDSPVFTKAFQESLKLSNSIGLEPPEPELEKLEIPEDMKPLMNALKEAVDEEFSEPQEPKPRLRTSHTKRSCSH